MFSQSSQAWNLASLGTYNFFVFLQSKRPKISIPVFSKPVVFYFSLYSIRVFFLYSFVLHSHVPNKPLKFDIFLVDAVKLM
jgi:hypothetical protein